MGDVIDIEENTPHACVVGPLNEPHIIPVEAIRRMASGENQLIQCGQEDEDEDLIRGLLRDWLILNGYDIEERIK